MKFTFKKEERLSSPVLIEKLYREGSSFLCYPLRFIFIQEPLKDGIAVKVLLTAPKKTFKRAVDRNLLKRRMRESYRQNKHLLKNELLDNQIVFAINYIGKQIEEYQVIDLKLKKGIDTLIKNIHSTNTGKTV